MKIFNGNQNSPTSHYLPQPKSITLTEQQQITSVLGLSANFVLIITLMVLAIILAFSQKKPEPPTPETMNPGYNGPAMGQIETLVIQRGRVNFYNPGQSDLA